ncbi:hypothetical protein SBV1_1450015 [Verrucomicrobia bacterium]|nr:hypothetical protein SBV1_1450015 [Verrucomicrobiota bacterium]
MFLLAADEATQIPSVTESDQNRRRHGGAASRTHTSPSYINYLVINVKNGPHHRIIRVMSFAHFNPSRKDPTLSWFILVYPDDLRAHGNP